VDFDDPSLVANAGLLLVGTLVVRLELERLVNQTMRLAGRVGGARPGRKVLTLVHAMVAGGSHIDHADMLRAGNTAGVLPHRVMAPSTLGTFLRAFTFGHVRQLEAVVGEVLRRAWSSGAGPGSGRLVIDFDSTISEGEGKQKQGAAFGYTKVLGYHPILATRADTGEVLHARMRKGSANTARERGGSLTSSSPGSAGPARPARLWRGSTRSSGRKRRSRPSAVSMFATRWRCAPTPPAWLL
jgi:hypothetical protein